MCILQRRIVKFEKQNSVSCSNILHITQTNMTVIFKSQIADRHNGFLYEITFVDKNLNLIKKKDCIEL